MSMDVSAELEVMAAAAREASILVMEIYATDFSVEMKGVNDPVTRADREANTLICERLAAAFPEHGIVAEESAPKTPEELLSLVSRERVFYVDPVDGTREFADKNGQFCVMIGLAIDGQAAAGAVAIPVENKLLIGSIAGGAFLESLAGAPNPKRLHIEQDPPTKIRAVVSRSHPSARTKAVLEHVGVTETIPCGSVGLKAARVIEGVAELYVHPSRGASLWDACGPEALIRGAGGVMTALSGRAIDYRGQLSITDGLIATTPALLPKILEALEHAKG